MKAAFWAAPYLFCSLLAMAGPSSPGVTPSDWSFVRALTDHHREAAEAAPPISDTERGPTPSAADLDVGERLGTAQRSQDLARFASDAPAPRPATHLVFISLGMPEGVLRALFRDGAGRPDVAFLLRGWEPPDLRPLLTRIHRLLPEQGDPPNLFFHPGLFREHAIEAAPVFVGPQGTVSGELALDRALELVADGGRPDPQGPLHALEEPDILQVIETRIAQSNWQDLLEQAKARAKPFPTSGHDLPKAEADRQYRVDPSIRLTQELRTPDGQRLAAVGDRFNPLDWMRLTRRYAVFDPLDPGQLEIVQAWLRDDPGLLLIATRIPEPLGEPGLAERLGHPVHALNAFIVERLRLVAVPALIEQDGSKLTVTLRKPER